jgi:hypothetical protein
MLVTFLDDELLPLRRCEQILEGLKQVKFVDKKVLKTGKNVLWCEYKKYLM